MPLTREQFAKLDAEGFSPEEIAGFEQRRQTEQPQPDILSQTGNALVNTAKNIINPIYRASANTLQGVEGIVRGGKMHTYTNPLTGDVVEPVKTIKEGLGTGAQAASILAMNPAKPILSGAIQGGLFSGGGALSENKSPLNIGLSAAGGATFGAGLGALTRLPEGVEKLKGLSNMGRGGVSKEEADRIANVYGESNAGLVDRIKSVLKNKREEADTAYKTAVNNEPKNFGGTIDVRNTVKTMQNVFKGSLGEATRGPQGNRLYQIMQELESRMPAPKGFYAETVPTPTQIGRQLKGENLTDIANEIRLNKKQFMEVRDALNNLYRENPYDRNIAKVMNSLYEDGENSGLIGLKNARNLQKQVFDKEDMFINGNTGDLKIATEAKLSKVGSEKLSKQELDHIRELEAYTGVPITKDATTINKLNKAKMSWQRKKDIATGAAIGTGISAIGLGGGGVVKKLVGH